VKVIHIAERDTQVADIAKKPGEFVNTWSIDGFVGEGNQPAELGWGTHEKALPVDGRHHDFGCGAAIHLNRRGAATRVRSWTPLEGPFHGFLIMPEFGISRWTTPQALVTASVATTRHLSCVWGDGGCRETSASGGGRNRPAASRHPIHLLGAP
jgi:Saccharopine dehydrogenase C-terminal domain